MTGAVRRTGAAVMACATLALGCGDDDPVARITPAQESDLHTLVERGRTAATAGDLDGTRTALDRLDAAVRALRDSGALAGDRAAELLKLSAVTKLKAARTLQPAAPAPAPPAAATSPAAVPPAGQKPKAKAKGKGKGKKGG
jgi:hypothetical protein